MPQRIDEKVNVILADNTPLSVHWRGRDYKITNMGIRHSYYEGKTLIHVFSVLSDSLFLKLKFNSKNLLWNLIEIYQE